MTEMDANNIDDNIQTQLQEEFLKPLDQIEEGNLVEGTIVQVDSEFVYIDIGWKSEGKIPVSEFKEVPSIGEVTNVVLEKKEGRNGEVIVSKKKADRKVIIRDLRKAFQDKEPFEGKISKVVKGGFEVSLGTDLTGFLPISKTDVNRVEKPEEYLELESKFLVERLYSDKKINIVLSRRTWMEEEIESKKKEFFENTQIGDEVSGAVKSFTSFGAFIDLGGFDGLLHINDMSWGHVTRPKDFVKKGQEIKLKVIRLDPEEQKINLSLKHFTDDPWMYFEDHYHIDDVIKGKVTKLTDFGAFIEIEEGIEGLAHISELSWVKRINHPKEILNIGDEVEAKILAYDIQQGRVSLGMKQVLPNPWDEIDAKYPVGDKLSRVVKKITNAGAFVELEEGIDGFLHIDDLSWTKKVKHPSQVIEEGQIVEIVITDIDPETKRIRLGMKQLSEDPWRSLQKNYPRGTIIDGEITNKTDFGIFVRVADDIEGLVHKANISADREMSPEDALASVDVGAKIKTAVIEVNVERRKLSLSVKEIQIQQERKEMSKYLQDDTSDNDTYTLADAIKNKD